MIVSGIAPTNKAASKGVVERQLWDPAVHGSVRDWIPLLRVIACRMMLKGIHLVRRAQPASARTVDWARGSGAMRMAHSIPSMRTA